MSLTSYVRSCARAHPRAVTVVALLVAANVGSWAWTLVAFRGYPLLLGTALLAYGLGLRHALDADHLAAIDNVTRKLMQDGRRPVGVGLLFSLGHSTVVVAASATIVATAAALNGRFAAFRSVGATIGTLVSAGFLLAIAAMNCGILAATYRTFRRVRSGGAYAAHGPEAAPSGGKLLARIFRPLFGMVRRSWHMYPLGVLFGLGFDTATEIGLLGISAAQASRGMPLWSILVFPVLFTAAMALVDTADNLLMLGAYGWGFAKPVRRLYYNLTTTAFSVVVALLVGGVEALGLVGDRLALRGVLWDMVGTLAANSGTLGYVVVAVFAATWGLAATVYWFNGYDALDRADRGQRARCAAPTPPPGAG